MPNEKLIAGLIDKGRGNKRMVTGVLNESGLPFGTKKSYKDFMTKWTCKCNLCAFSMDFLPSEQAFEQIEEHVRTTHKQIVESAIQNKQELPVKLFIKRS
jgi:hypothetical protein